MSALLRHGAIIAERPEAHMQEAGSIEIKLTSEANHAKISATPAMS
jgi:hypothetical protein